MSGKCLFIVLFALLCAEGFTQELQFRGRIKCSNDPSHRSTRGAEKLIVVPTALPTQSVYTTSDPNAGFYFINTGLDVKVLDDRTVRLLVITSCDECTEDITRFISKDQLKYDDHYFIDFGTKKIKHLCDDLEFDVVAIDTVMNKILAQENRDVKNEGWAATPALLNILFAIPPAAAPPPDSIVVDYLPIESTSEARITYGELLLYSSFANSSSGGFNFAPTRDFSETVFWNPAAIFEHADRANVSTSTNWRNQFKSTAFFKIKPGFGLGIGFLGSRQKDSRTLFNDEIDQDIREQFRLRENATYISASWKPVSFLSIGLSGKWISQKFDNYQMIERTRVYNSGNLRRTEYETVTKEEEQSHYDMDLSVYLPIHRSFRFGFNVMNLLNSKLFGSNYLSDESPTYVNQFSYGAGMVYKYRRFNLGYEVLIHDQKVYNSTVGINIIPIDQLLLSGSWSTKYNAYSVSIKYGKFKTSFTNNQDLIFHEHRGNSSRFLIEKPYLYSSISWDF